MQVSLLNQEIIIEKIQSVVESRLRSSNETQTFQEQVLLAKAADGFQYVERDICFLYSW